MNTTPLIFFLVIGLPIIEGLRQEVAQELESEVGSMGLRNRRATQQARQVSEEVHTMEEHGTPTNTIAHDINAGGSVVGLPGNTVTNDMVMSAHETNGAIEDHSEHTGWTRPDNVVNSAHIPRQTGYSGRYPGHNAAESERRAFMAHLDALLTEASFMEHEETREEWEKHAVLCDQGFKFPQRGKQDAQVGAGAYHLDEDLQQTYEGDANTRLGLLDDKVELIIRTNPPTMVEFECTTCKDENGSGGSQGWKNRMSGGESLKFSPKTGSPVPLVGTGVAVLAAPGLFSYSFTYNADTSEIQVGFSGRAFMNVELEGSAIKRIKVTGGSFQGDTPDTMSPEKHEYHCEAAKLNRHSKKITVIQPNSGLPSFPNFLGEFEVTGIEHNEGEEKNMEDGAFLKVDMWGCGPCAHSVREHNQNMYGLQEVNTGGEPCGMRGKKTDEQCPPTATKQYYGEWYFTTKKFDSEVLPEVQVLETEMEIANTHLQQNSSTGAWRMPYEEGGEIYWDLQDLVARIRDQELKFPFNHKLERLEMTLEKCNKNFVGKIVCPIDSSSKEVRYLHDGALMHDSAEDVLFEYLKSTPSRTAPKLTAPQGDAGMHFNLYNTALKGGLNWEVTVAAPRRCTPAMQENFYVGIGADTNADLDLGLMLWKRTSNSVALVDYVNWGRKGIRQGGAIQYSGDNRNGAGEGDDEWMFLKLHEIKEARKIDYITIHVNIFDGGVSFSDLEGAFARFVEGPADVQSAKGGGRGSTFEDAHTVQYLDLDAMKESGSARAVLLGVLFLDRETNIPLPEATKVDLPDDVYFQLASVRHPLVAAQLSDRASVNAIKAWWNTLRPASKTAKVQSNNAITNLELGQDVEDVRAPNGATTELAELPGLDPVVMELDAQTTAHDPHVSAVDRELAKQTAHMGGSDSFSLNDGSTGHCVHTGGEGSIPQLVMQADCGLGGSGIQFLYTPGEDGKLNLIDRNGWCAAPASESAGAEVNLIESECGAHWEPDEDRYMGKMVMKYKSFCMGLQGSTLVLVWCTESNVAKFAPLANSMLVPGLYDNLLTEFPGGPPGTDALCLQ